MTGSRKSQRGGGTGLPRWAGNPVISETHVPDELFYQARTKLKAPQFFKVLNLDSYVLLPPDLSVGPKFPQKGLEIFWRGKVLWSYSPGRETQ